MIQHIVFLYWNDGVDADAIHKVSQAFSVLKHTLPMIADYRWGEDLGFYDNNADYVLLAQFETKQDFEAYAVHPDHIAMMKETIAPIMRTYHSAQFTYPE